MHILQKYIHFVKIILYRYIKNVKAQNFNESHYITLQFQFLD